MDALEATRKIREADRICKRIFEAKSLQKAMIDFAKEEGTVPDQPYYDNVIKAIEKYEKKLDTILK